jgi:hypothetical protein
MDARQKLGEKGGRFTMAGQEARRTSLRYRLAELMTREQFQEAWDLAHRACDRGEIRESDLRFVKEIVEAAGRMNER